MLQTFLLQPIFAYMLVLIVSSSSLSIEPIFDPRVNLMASSPSRTPLPAPILIQEPINTALIDTEPVVLLPVVTRSQRHVVNKGDGNLDNLPPEPEPSCEELKTMWRDMRKIARQMELTNEVPKIRDPFVGGAYDFRPSKYPSPNPYSKGHKSSKFNNVFHNRGFQVNGRNKFAVVGPKPGSRNFGAILRDQDDHHRYKNEISSSPILGNSVIEKSYRKPASSHLGFESFDPNDNVKASPVTKYRGRFENSPLPEEALGVYGTVVNTPEEKDRYRSRTRRPPQTSFRTRLVGLDRAPIKPFRPRERHGEYHYGSVVTHYPGDRPSGINTPSSGSGGTLGGSSMYHPLGGFAEFPTEVNQRSSNAAARVERIDKINASTLRNSCLRIQNKVCKTDVDCYCLGNPKLFCGGNKCRPRYKIQRYDRNPSWTRNSYVVDTPYELDLVQPYDWENDFVWPATHF